MAPKVYLSKEVLRGFDQYKYSSVDTSPVSNYITHPFWNWAVKFVPLWVAPNVLTLTGFILLLVNFAVMTYYDVDFTAATAEQSVPPKIPNWVWLFGAFNNFLAHTLDGIDGKQARRTGSSSPLGELFDHGLDSWASVLLPVALYSIFGRGAYGQNVLRVYYIVLGVQFFFLLSHWEKYNTGVLFLPWGYDISQIGMTGLYVITYFYGVQFWMFRVPYLDITSGQMFEILVHLGFFVLTFPITCINIYRAYRDRTGKMRSFSEAVRPLVSTVLLFSLFLLWIRYSQYDILEKHPRLFYWTTGAAFSNIACRLIIAQMSNTRCELLNNRVIILTMIVGLVFIVPQPQYELYLLWSYCLYSSITHFIYGVFVVREMCAHFRINAFTITPKKIK
ncbi:hypothetical protein LOTGIDRAFT_152421 [Lottia gigantea]|uniref:Selenoprotein I n=1 Tax=Lottia gigantea TaxID=225164 RepID=V4AN21_LOTGI|nr:hypothetical protein LOTGIDRAFT_152421 [Lottia gigantea]ESP05564.1 hypothetical protein LOTGIDRAFT_152421 [Lottia gigantea]